MLTEIAVRNAKPADKPRKFAELNDRIQRQQESIRFKPFMTSD
jgi:hypothetical protein